MTTRESRPAGNTPPDWMKCKGEWGGGGILILDEPF